MRKNLFAAVISVASLSAGAVFGVGPDTAGSGTQDYSFMLDNGNSVSISNSTSTVKATGTSADGLLANPFESTSQLSIQAKWAYGNTSLGISQTSPYGINLNYTTGFMNNVGATINSSETAILASRGIGNGVKVFGGVRLNSFKATVDAPYMALPAGQNAALTKAGGYQYTLDTGTSTGFTIGAAYEIPQIYLRASIQFNTEIKHNSVKVTESFLGATLNTNGIENYLAPSSTIIKLRSALSPKLIAFGNWRSSTYDALIVSGPVYTQATAGENIYDPSSGVDYTLGVAFVVSDNFTVLGGMARGMSKSDGGNESPLSPFGDTSSTFIGANFKYSDSIELSASYSLTSLGDANVDVVETPGAFGTASFTDNTSNRLTIGTKISF